MFPRQDFNIFVSFHEHEVQELGNSQEIYNGILHLLCFFAWEFVDVAELVVWELMLAVGLDISRHFKPSWNLQELEGLQDSETKLKRQVQELVRRLGNLAGTVAVLAVFVG